MSDLTLFQQCQSLLDQGEPFVLVSLIEASGSTPQDQGAKMIVSAQGRVFGTVGGGRLEAKATDVAAAMLREGPNCQFLQWNLKADVGMTCGGSVKLYFELYGVDSWPIVIFGAGHVAQSLTRLLIMLPCQVTCYDPRAEWLAQLPEQVRRVQVENPATCVTELSQEAYVLCMSQGHRTDLPILQELLSQQNSYPFVGVIGSRAKSAVLRKELDAAGVNLRPDSFHCPVGLDLGNNHPGEIAVSIAAQLIQVRDAHSRDRKT